MEKPKDYVLVGGKRMTVDVVDPQTVVFNLPAPKPGLLAHFAFSFAQGFQPKHFLAPYHPELSANADKLAQKAGFENGLAVIKAYFGNSDWTDTPSPLLNSPDKVAKLPADVFRHWKVTSTSRILQKVGISLLIHTSTSLTRRVTSCLTSASRMRCTKTTTS